MDFARKVSFLTLDVISHIGLGEPFGDLRTDADVDGFLEAGNFGLWMNTQMLSLHIPWVFRALGPTEKDRTGLRKMVANARRVIEARLKKGDMTKKSDMLSSFMRHGLGTEDLITEACSLLGLTRRQHRSGASYCTSSRTRASTRGCKRKWMPSPGTGRWHPSRASSPTPWRARCRTCRP